MTNKTFAAVVGCLIAGYLTRQLQVVIDVTIVNAYGGIIANPMNNLAPILGKLAYFVMHHIVEYVIGAIIIASVTSRIGSNAPIIIAFLTGAIFKPVINSAKGLFIYNNSVAVSDWVRSILIQDLISSLIVLPIVVIATAIFLRRQS